MGYYLDLPDMKAKGKADFLIQHENAQESECIPDFETERELGKAIVCVIENPMFDAAGFAYSPQELREFANPDGRFKRWLLMPWKRVKELTGCPY